MEQQLIEVKTTGNRQDRRSYWRRQVREWRESGEKQAEYCRQRGLNQYTFYRWRRRLGEEGTGLGSGTVAVEFFQGYQGAVQCDGFDGYDRLEKFSAIVLHGCMAHARRKFVAVATLANKSGKKKGQPTAAAEFLRLFQKLYRIEKVAREAAMTPDQRKDFRQREAVPVLEELKKLMLATQPKTDPSCLLGKAIAYTVNQWERLRRYVDNGHVEIDNNAVERAIRPFVIGRNNWLFSGVPRGADASAAIYSLIETAKLNGIEPSRYLNVLFSRLPSASTLEDYEQLLPFAVNKPFLDTVVV